MSTGNQTRKRARRFSSLAHQQGWWGQFLTTIQRGSVLVRLGLCAATAIILLLITQGWTFPRTFYEGQIPARELITRTAFEQVDEEKTRDAQKRERSLALAVYENDPAPLDQLWARLQNDVEILVGAENFADVDADVWMPFEIPRVDEGTPAPEQQFAMLKEQFSQEGARESFNNALEDSLRKIRQTGLLDALPSDRDINFRLIAIRPRAADGAQPTRDVAVEDVLIEPTSAKLQTDFRAKMPTQELADAAFHWLREHLPVTVTLTLNEEETRKAQDEAEKAVEPILRIFSPEPNAENSLAPAGVPLDATAVERLELEHKALMAKRTWLEQLGRSLAVVGMYTAIFSVCGFFTFFQSPRIVENLRSLITLLISVVLTIGIAVILASSTKGWQSEAVPLVLFAMIAAVAYGQTLAILFSAGVVLVFIVGQGVELSGALVLLAAMAGAILTLARVRSRSKLLFVGLSAAFVALSAALGAGIIAGQSLFPGLVLQGARLALWAMIAGSLMTCILPLIEKIFGVQTDISLIELGDPAHPLLQELIRRAPGTYNHSITVASLAEAAADAIGARSLLVRVGAYFHDIGKMLKPGYFIENQSQGDNRHESLVPAMSTLVIIAHVKDGADLARQHRLPDSMVDFIQQHHGTTLVEYFYRRASELKNDEQGEAVDESSFRYPGPKPQTKEAAVLMISDAVESASRVLTEPTPSRIENLVREITMKRLLDGQFDECDLTLEEVHTVEDSLVKSLTAVYHGRVKYPEPETA